MKNGTDVSVFGHDAEDAEPGDLSELIDPLHQRPAQRSRLFSTVDIIRL
jgi:hypothetical protein